METKLDPEILPEEAIRQLEEYKQALHALVDQIALTSAQLLPPDPNGSKSKPSVQIIISYPDAFMDVCKDIYDSGKLIEQKPLTTVTKLRSVK